VILIATPEFNTTMPGQLKHVVDWASRPYGSGALWGKPAAAIGASVTDYGAMWAQDHLRKALGIAGARVLGFELPVAKVHERFDHEGKLTDAEIRNALAEVVTALTEQGQLAEAA
jgi:chromate reductase, NAD(P)H dehydrogenase (quinone)